MARAAILAGLVFARLPLLSTGQCIVTIAGPLSIEGTPATAQQLSGPTGVAVDVLNGGYVISDNSGHTLRRVWSNGTMTTILGTWRLNGAGVDGEAGINGTLLNGPGAIIPDGAGGFYFCDRGNNVVRRLLANGTVVRVAGNTTGRFTPSPNGDGPATSVSLNFPGALSLDSDGGLWIADSSRCEASVMGC